jgi:hypothetical protein
MFKTHLIQYFEHPFFRSCGFLPTLWINFSHSFFGFMHAHLHYISCKFLSTWILLLFHPNLVHDKRFSRRVLFALTHFCALRPTIATHLTCVFSFVGRWYTHSWFCLGCVICFFLITRGVWCIRTFNVTNKMCYLVCIGVRVVYITLSKFFYTWI